jgi:hypothetical protein
VCVWQLKKREEASWRWLVPTHRPKNFSTLGPSNTSLLFCISSTELLAGSILFVSSFSTSSSSSPSHELPAKWRAPGRDRTFVFLIFGSPTRQPKEDTRLDDPHPVGPRFPGSSCEKATPARAPKLFSFYMNFDLSSRYTFGQIYYVSDKWNASQLFIVLFANW